MSRLIRRRFAAIAPSSTTYGILAMLMNQHPMTPRCQSRRWTLGGARGDGRLGDRAAGSDRMRRRHAPLIVHGAAHGSMWAMRASSVLMQNWQLICLLLSQRLRPRATRIASCTRLIVWDHLLLLQGVCLWFAVEDVVLTARGIAVCKNSRLRVRAMFTCGEVFLSLASKCSCALNR